MKKSRTLRAVLSLALVVVFAGVFYEVKDAMTSEDGRIAPSLTDARKFFANRSSYVYRADVRDPFLLAVPVGTSRSPLKPVAKPPVWTAPPYTLNGTIVNGSGRVAVIESRVGETFFLTEGDSNSGLVIRKIHNDSVFYSCGGQKGSWRVR